MSGLIFFNANVITMDPAQPKAGLVSIVGSQIQIAAGGEMFERLKKRGTRAIDCAGRTLMPGFVDAHCHVHAYAESLVSINLSPGEQVYSVAALQRKIHSFCQDRPPGTWIRGKGYDEFYLAEQRHPNRWDLDAAAQFHPVKLTHRSGHAHVLNSLALKHIGINAETGDPLEGMIDRDLESGEPTGILYGMGGYLAEKVPLLDNAEMQRGVALASSKLLSYGITSVQDASFVNDHFQVEAKMRAAGSVGKEFERMARLGRVAPDVWMSQATGSPVGPETLLDATGRALTEIGAPH